MCYKPSLDNVVLNDFCSEALTLLCDDVGVHGTYAISFGDFVGYTSIPWAHYGSLESSGVDLAP